MTESGSEPGSDLSADDGVRSRDLLSVDPLFASVPPERTAEISHFSAGGPCIESLVVMLRFTATFVLTWLLFQLI